MAHNKGWGWSSKRRDPRLRESVDADQLEQMKIDYFARGGTIKKIPMKTSGLPEFRFKKS